MHKERNSAVDKLNKERINMMKEKGEIAYTLEDKSAPVTLNTLINFCKEQNIDFEAPIFLECPDGYFPLAYYHNGVGHSDDGNEYTLGVLVITDGEW